MARSHERAAAKRRKELRSRYVPITLGGDIAEIDAFYGETLRPLLPRRLTDLLTPLARAA